MNYEEALKYIYSRELFGIKLGLGNISELMQSLGNPQEKFKSIHVAGTNGKGSVCSFIASVLEKEGYKVGVYTSPHLVDFRERIRVNGKKIGKKSVVSLLSKIKPFVREHTFFEVVTAMAFMYFKEKGVDFALVEVGMGGRLDATNVVTPEVAVITNISLEHTEHLGDTIEKIAFEKAGIIKPGVDVVTSENGRGLKVIRKVCMSKKCRLNVVKPRKVRTSLNGDFQYQNVSLALEAIAILRKKGYKIKKESVIGGLRTAKWPGRMEFISENMIFDCAHNPSGAKALAKELSKMKKDVYLIIGIMKDKDIGGICRALEPAAKGIIITKPKIARAAMPGDIAKHIRKNVVVIGRVSDALEYAKIRAGKKNLVVVAGSIFLVGEAFESLRLQPFN
ncbi:bifunctional folylpolyglutamate synthase/dihydrofolate synthase [Candidatus Woesearchaeota archaeon]|nr:bifunctional folylpolyglutamate synthase/dihydrofolate synthase [Candidatus Woesearchaeota archaeon]